MYVGRLDGTLVRLICSDSEHLLRLNSIINSIRKDERPDDFRITRVTMQPYTPPNECLQLIENSTAPSNKENPGFQSEKPGLDPWSYKHSRNSEGIVILVKQSHDHSTSIVISFINEINRLIISKKTKHHPYSAN
jgi:hypothetical protein